MFTSLISTLCLKHTKSSQTFCREFKSAICYEKLYPNKSFDILEKPDFKSILNDQNDNFSGFIPIDKLQITHKTCQKPGGQHVNKTQSGVEIRFHVDSATWIPEKIRNNFKKQQITRINKDGFFIVTSEKTRKNLLNQADCLERIRALIRAATKISTGLSQDDLNKIEINKKIADGRRLIEKSRKKEIKSYRQRSIYDEDVDGY